MPIRGCYRRMRWRIGIRDRGVQRTIRVSRERVLEEVEPVNLVPGMLSATRLSRLVQRLGLTESSVCMCVVPRMDYGEGDKMLVGVLRVWREV